VAAIGCGKTLSKENVMLAKVHAFAAGRILHSITPNFILEFITLNVNSGINSILYSAWVIVMSYAERIRVLREDRDKTQAEIAALLKVGQRTYCDYEHGKTRIPVDSLILLAKYYDVNMDYICGVSRQKGRFPTR